MPTLPPVLTRLPDLPPAVTGRRAPLIGGAVVGGLVLLWLVAYLAAGSGIPRGTTVRGVAVGGMSRQEAAATLRRELGHEARAPVTVRVAADTFRVDPARAGLSFDVTATVEAAGGRSWNPVALVGGLFGGEEIEPVTSVDDEALRAATGRLARRADAEPADGDVRFVGAKVVTVQPRPGRRLDGAGAAEALADSYLRADQPVELPAHLTQPAVPAAEVRRAVRTFARPAVSAPVALEVEGRHLSIPPRLIGSALSMEPDDEQRLRPRLRGQKLKRLVAGLLEPVEVDPRDATFRIVGGRPRVVPAERGREVSPEDLSAAVLPSLTEAPGPRTARVRLTVSDPRVTTADARGLGVTELVSEYTTYYPTDFPPRLTNIHRAADLMDGTLLLPGEVFSLNSAVGERTAARGFAAGYVIDNGKLAVDLGGGVSQLATTTFNAAFFAGLEDVEHHTHSFYISRYPEGREATVAWGAKDMRFRNDSGHGVFVTTSHTAGSVTVRLWGSKQYDVKATKSDRMRVRPFDTVYDPRPEGTEPGDCVPQEGVPGFRVDVARLFYQGGQQVRSENHRTHYLPEDRVVCGADRPR